MCDKFHQLTSELEEVAQRNLSRDLQRAPAGRGQGGGGWEDAVQAEVCPSGGIQKKKKKKKTASTVVTSQLPSQEQLWEFQYLELDANKAYKNMFISHRTHACRVPCRGLVPASHRGRQVWGHV